jgi:hypothetical protein
MFKYGILIVLAVVFCFVSCGGQEETAIDTFLQAVKDKDETALGVVSSVGFPGDVSSWEIVEIGPEATETFHLPELRRKALNAKADLDMHVEKRGYFMRDNARVYKEHQAVLQENPDAELKGDLAEFDEKWQEFLQEENSLGEKLQAANADVQREQNTATISLMGGSVTEVFEGDVLVREALVNVDQTPYKITIRKYNLMDKTTNNRPRSRWIVTDIQKQS